MISLHERVAALSRRFVLRSLLSVAFVPAVAWTASAQSGGDAIYGVTAFDVAPGAASQGVALLKQYRDGALKQAGNLGVTLLQEADWPNRFVIYEGWKDQAAYDANDKAAHSAELARQAQVHRRRSLRPARLQRHLGRARPARRQAATPSTCSCISTSSRPASMRRWRPPRRWPRPPARAKAICATTSCGRSSRRLSHTTLLAAWQNRKAFDAYENSAYARQFRDAVGPLLGSPFDDRLYVPIN